MAYDDPTPERENDDHAQTTAADGAELLRRQGDYDGDATLSVYYAAFGTTFRARLRPVESREALALSDLSEVEVKDGETEVVHTFDLSTQLTHVPPVVRNAVSRPVQFPET
jgi:hypothetical protein